MCKNDDWFEVLAGDTFGIAARFLKLGTTNDPLLPGDIESIVINVYDVTGTRRLVDSWDADKSDVFFSTYQTNPRWLANEDSTGFNFATDLRLTDIDRRYHVEAVLVLDNGKPHVERWPVKVV